MTTDYDAIIIGSGGWQTVRIKILPQHLKALRANGTSRIYTCTSPTLMRLKPYGVRETQVQVSDFHELRQDATQPAVPTAVKQHKEGN